MIKRINFTERRRIPRDRVDIEVYDGQPRRFDATINLQDIQLMADAAVYLEATCAGSTVIERFEFGEVGKLRVPANRLLRGIEGENVFFTLKVVDRREQIGCIIGLAEHIRPQRAGKQTASGRRGILPIEPADLGQELWRLDFGDRDVVLQVNKDIPTLFDGTRSDPLFFSAIFPQVVRHIVSEAIMENVDIEEDDDRWPILWLRFAKDLHPDKETPPKPDDSKEDREEWMASVVRAFCDAHGFKDRYAAAIADRNGSDA